jgi:hypothetical protein
VPALCNVLGTSEKHDIRQYAVVLLRKHLNRKKHWMQLKADIKKGYDDLYVTLLQKLMCPIFVCSLKEGLIQALVSEPNKNVKSSIAQLMGGIVRHLKNVDKDWPELLQFFQNTVTNNDPEKQEVK